MAAIRGLTVCVGEWYAGTFAIAAPRNLRHLTDCLVVTDEATAPMLPALPDLRILVTDAFTRHGARFNKGLAIEEGLDALGRSGWILIHDADVILPASLELSRVRPATLHGARRRMLDDPGLYRPDLDWTALPLGADGGPIGFFQLFNATDRHLKNKQPWYDVSFAHAGGGDAYFLEHWPPGARTILPIEVLHLGPRDTHWFGANDAGRATMSAFMGRNGWPRGPHLPEPAPGPIVDRVAIPGYPPSSFRLPGDPPRPKAPEPPLPSLATMAGNLARAAGRAVVAATTRAPVRVDRATYETRRTICAGCPHWRSGDQRCSICGCKTEFKLWGAQETCPGDPPRWLAIKAPAPAPVP